MRIKIARIKPPEVRRKEAKEGTKVTTGTRTRTKLGKRVLSALRDVPDIRDRMYEPTLAPLPAAIAPPAGLRVLDQKDTDACTGFSLAAIVQLLLRRGSGAKLSPTTRHPSPFMLYDMARRHDEWPGEKYGGSSLRGALRGFYNCGVCDEKLWPTEGAEGFSLESAKDARETTLGAYFRLRPHLPDYHAALSETGAIYVSAAIHDGWDYPKKGVIESGTGFGLHAFVIVGYDATGFIIQNSWGTTWGKKGLAHWSYKDWAANIQDAWVLQLAVSTPTAFGLGMSAGRAKSAADLAGVKRAKPARQDIAGHFVHVDNGAFSDEQPYWSTKEDVAATAKHIASVDRYKHFLFYAHGGLNSPDEAAIRAAAMIEGFKANDIYPYNVFYDTGLLKALGEIILGRGAAVVERAAGLLDVTDDLVEKAVGGVGTKIWNEMKADARLPFVANKAGDVSLQLFIAAFVAKAKATGAGPKIHLVGHSTGAILIGHLLNALDRLLPGGATIASCSLMAPACSIAFYQENYRSRLGKQPSRVVKIDDLTVYNLTDEREQKDEVTFAYRKSLLYLVSNAFEPEKSPMPLLGMQKFSEGLEKKGPLTIHYAGTPKAPTESMTHGGFDNDPVTMNAILRTVLGKAPQRPFSKEDLSF